MKHIVLILIIVISIITWCAFQPCYLIKEKITFCDSRPPVIFEYTAFVPDGNIINNKMQAVPTYYGYMNVCQVDLISITEIK